MRRKSVQSAGAKASAGKAIRESTALSGCAPVEDITGTHTDPYHYKLYFHTDILPSVEVKP